jgi:hypothetical protein
MICEVYPNNPFARDVFNESLGISFGSDFELLPVDSHHILSMIQISPLKRLDSRAKVVSEPGYTSVFEGIDFDPENLRSQSFVLLNREKQEPVAVMCLVVAPKGWIEHQRYFQRTETGVIVRDFSYISNESLPDFLIIPA